MNLLALLGASLLFSLFDYRYYNLTGGSRLYRVAQLIFQATLTTFLWHSFGWPTAIAFNLIWWTWGLDLLYYQWGRFLPPYDTLTKDKQVTWAWWTPGGLLLYAIEGKKPIPHVSLYEQVAFGAIIAIQLCLK